MLIEKILIYYTHRIVIKYIEWTKFPISPTSANTTNILDKQHLSSKTNLAVIGHVMINVVM